MVQSLTSSTFKWLSSLIGITCCAIAAGGEPLTPEQTARSKRAVAAKRDEVERPTPTAADVRYGKYDADVLDFWQAKSDKPTPLIVFIHGGGFMAGDKNAFVTSMLVDALANGFSFASINYRLVDGEKILFPVPQHDSARAMQFLRSKASDWNIDPQRVVCYGASAGAGIAMYLGFHDDLANPSSDDPVERLSSRVLAVGTFGGQSTYDPVAIKEIVGGRAWEHPCLLAVAGLHSMDEAMQPTPEVAQRYRECAPIDLLTNDDPPLYMVYTEEDVAAPKDGRPGQNIHHPNFGKQLKAKMDALGIENKLVLARGTPRDQTNSDMLEWFKKRIAEAGK